MLLIGMFDSPFVWRVAVSMKLLEIPFEHRNWSVGKDFELIRQFNPLAACRRWCRPTEKSYSIPAQSWISWMRASVQDGRCSRAPASSAACDALAMGEHAHTTRA